MIQHLNKIVERTYIVVSEEEAKAVWEDGSISNAFGIALTAVSKLRHYAIFKTTSVLKALIPS